MLLISPLMDLDDLMAQMGPNVTSSEAEIMREILVTRYFGQFVENIPEDRWFAALDHAARAHRDAVTPSA